MSHGVGCCRAGQVNEQHQRAGHRRERCPARQHRSFSRGLCKAEGEGDGDSEVNRLRRAEAMSSIVSVGDILEISCENAVGYVSYAGKHDWFGDAIWVVPGLFPSESRGNWSAIFGRDGYFTFYPVHAAIKQKLLQKVGYALEAIRPIPTAVRTVVNIDESGRALSWLITDGSVRTPRKDAELSTEERSLPIGSIWNHKLLCERVTARWTPDTPPPAE